MRKTTRRRQTGSALITAILVILILTVIGIGIAYFTQVEDRISGNDRLMKEGFYAAETGLKIGEALIQANVASVDDVTRLYHAGLPPPAGNSLPSYTLPDGSVAVLLNLAPPAIPPTYPAKVDMSGIPAATAGVVDQAWYSLYVQNNLEDPGWNANPSASNETEQPSRMNLISVGVVQLAGGTGITKILQEQLMVAVGGSDSGTQKQANAGGTGSGAIQ